MQTDLSPWLTPTRTWERSTNSGPDSLTFRALETVLKTPKKKLEPLIKSAELKVLSQERQVDE